MQGFAIPKIARLFRVSERTIHRWLAQHVDEFRESFENVPACNLIAEQLQDITEMERIAMTESMKAGSKRDKYGLLKAAMQARQMRIDLMLKTGVLPQEPARLYSVMVEEKPTVSADHHGRDGKRSADEIKQSINHKAGFRITTAGVNTYSGPSKETHLVTW